MKRNSLSTLWYMAVVAGAMLFAAGVTAMAMAFVDGHWIAIVFLLALVALALMPVPKRINKRYQLRIADQAGLGYLILHVVRDRRLIEKQGKRRGAAIRVKWRRFPGGGAANEALLNGRIDVAAGDAESMLGAWDRGAGQNKVKAIAVLHEALDAPASQVLLYTTERFAEEQSIVYAALLDALEEAELLIERDSEAAAATYRRVNHSKLEMAAIRRWIEDSERAFPLSSGSLTRLAEQLWRGGRLKAVPRQQEHYLLGETKPRRNR